MLPLTNDGESSKGLVIRQLPQTVHHNFIVPKKNVDGAFLLQIFNSTNSQNMAKIPKSLQINKRQLGLLNRFRHGSTFNSFSQQKTVKMKSASFQGKQFQSKNKNQLRTYIDSRGQSKHIKTSLDTFLFKKSVDLRDPFFGFDDPEKFQKILVTKKRFYHNQSPATNSSLDKEEQEQKMKKQQTETQHDCRGIKYKLLQSYLSEIKRNRDDIAKKKISITNIKKRSNMNSMVQWKKTLNQFLPKLNIYKSDSSGSVDSVEMMEEKAKKLLNLTSKSLAVLYGGYLVFERNGDEKREIASLTKIMTCITGLFLIEKFQLIWEKILVKVSRQAVSLGGTTANLRSGDQVTLKDLFFGMMLPSGNDAAFSIGQFFGRLLYQQANKEKQLQNSVRRSKTPVFFQQTDQPKKLNFINSREAVTYFIREMNKIAQHLQLSNTFFTNCHGLADPSNYSASNELTVISYHCFQNSKFRVIISTKQYESKIYNKNVKMSRIQQWINSNLLLHNGNNQCFGGKTGYTPSAGPCLMTCFKREQKVMVVVLLNCSTKEGRFKQTEGIYHKFRESKINKKISKEVYVSKNEKQTKSSQIFDFEIHQ